MDNELLTQLTPQLVSGALLALALDLIPGIKTAWAKLETRQKQAYNLLIVLVVSVSFVAIPAAINNQWPEGWNWLLLPLASFFVTFAGNQSAYVGTRYITNSSAPRITEDDINN